MALIVKDRVQETSTTTGTGTITLAGAVAGFQSFSVIGDANTTYYAIVMDSSFEIGIGTYTSSGTTLSRTTVLESSNAGSLVNFSAGTKSVFCTYPAEKGLYLDASGNAIALGTPASATLTNATGLPISTGVSGLGTGVATFLATPSSANLATSVTDETGSGNLVFATSPTLVTPILGTPTSGTATNLTGLPLTTGVTGTLPIANGGTNLTTYTTGDIVYASATNTLNKLADVATGNALISGGVGAAPSYGKIGLTTHVSGTLPVANGGTGVTSSTGTTAVVLSTSPTLVTPVLGVATATSVNKVALTAPATSATLTIADGKTLTASNTLTLAGTDATTMTFPPTTSKIGYLNIPPAGTKTSSYTLTTSDIGEYVQVGSGGSITIPNSTFAEGDAISIFNNTSAAITITCTITTAYIGGTDADKATVSLATRGVCTILFISGTVCVITGNVS
jgi:hypothetical protein